MRECYGCAVDLAKIIATLTGCFAKMPRNSGYVIPDYGVGGAYRNAMQFCKEYLCCRKGRVVQQTIATSNIKTSTTSGVGAPEIRAVVVRYYPCASKNGVFGEPCPKGYVRKVHNGSMRAMGESPNSATQLTDCGKISNAMYRINGRLGSAIGRCRGAVSGIPFFAGYL